MRRAVKLLGLLALAPILMGHGGINPPPPGAKISSNPKFRATIILDPHNALGDVFGTADPLNVTSTAKMATIQLRDKKKGDTLYQVDFKALPNFPLFLGCDPTLTAGRFVYTPANGALLSQWVPPAALTFLFASQGIAVGPLHEPAITQILSNQCVDDPQNEFVLGPGLLLLDVMIQFQVFP